MGCCFGKGNEELPPAFDPVIGLSTRLRAPTIVVDGNTISGSGSIFADSPVLQVCQEPQGVGRTKTHSSHSARFLFRIFIWRR